MKKSILQIKNNVVKLFDSKQNKNPNTVSGKFATNDQGFRFL